MVIGFPNVGKSSLINALARLSGHGGLFMRGYLALTIAAPAGVGAKPGFTRGLSAMRISERPPLYVLDTPGVMLPRVETPEQGMRLALTGTQVRWRPPHIRQGLSKTQG